MRTAKAYVAPSKSLAFFVLWRLRFPLMTRKRLRRSVVAPSYAVGLAIYVVDCIPCLFVFFLFFSDPVRCGLQWLDPLHGHVPPKRTKIVSRHCGVIKLRSHRTFFLRQVPTRQVLTLLGMTVTVLRTCCKYLPSFTNYFYVSIN
jgi:hypothetical protein